MRWAKGKASLGDYEVRTWRGWHHQALALVAAWFLTQEALLGKKWTPAVTQVQELIAGVVQRWLGTERAGYQRRAGSRRLRRVEEARCCRCKALNRLPPWRVGQLE